MDSLSPKSAIAEFELAVRKNFEFLEVEHGFRFTGLREFDDDPRDSCTVARYASGDVRIDIAWSAMEMSLGVLIRLDVEGLRRAERHIYLEPFIEFISEGSMSPVVPHIYSRLSIKSIENAMIARSTVFLNGIDRVLEVLASRLREHYIAIRSLSPQTVRQYHSWYQSR